MSLGLPRRPSGLTLIEAMIVLCIASILLGSTLPDFQRLFERSQVESVAAEFETDVYVARSLAAARNQSVRMTFRRDGVSACYLIHTGPADSCRCNGLGAAICINGAEPLRAVHFPGEGRVRLEANVSSILVDAELGTLSPTATVKVISRGGHIQHRIVNIMGRVRSCSPGGNFPGVPACS